MLTFLLGCSLDAGVHRQGTGVVRGHVVFEDGTPVAGAEVSVGDVPREADGEGAFEVEVPAGDAVIVVRADGATMNQVTVPVESGATVDALVRVVALRAATLADATAGGEVRTDDGLVLTFPPNALADEGGQLATGEVRVEYALLNTATSLLAAPGGLLAVERDGELVQLRSNGMVDVRVSQGGAPLQLVAPAELSFPVIGNAPPCDEPYGAFWFDEAEGAWVEDGSGRVTEDGLFTATVDHFSYWNCDARVRGDGCIFGTLLDRDGSPLANRLVGVWLSDGTATELWTDALGGFLVQATVGSTVTVGVVWDLEGVAAESEADAIWSFGQVDVQAGEAGCMDLGRSTPTGTDLDGDGEPIAPWGRDCDDHDASATAPCPWEGRMRDTADTGTCSG